MPVAVTEGTFEQEVLRSDKAVIVDFWAEWCGPCHAIAPALERIGEEHQDKVKIAKVNVDEEQGLMARYGIVSIPTLIMFKDGEPAKSVIGARPKSALEREFGLVDAE